MEKIGISNFSLLYFAHVSIQLEAGAAVETVTYSLQRQFRYFYPKVQLLQFNAKIVLFLCHNLVKFDHTDMIRIFLRICTATAVAGSTNFHWIHG